MARHDPVAFASALSAKLATRSRHVCLFLGAGAARACGLPDVKQLEKRVLGALPKQACDRFTAQLDGRNMEQALSRLRRISALLDGDQQVDGLTGADAAQLDAAVCRSIVESLSLDQAELEPMLQLAAWVGRANYHLPLEVFTVNYDLLVETALERLRVPYFDGFVGALSGRFHTELVEGTPTEPDSWLPSFFARLWKLHGSVNWRWEENGHPEIVRLGRPIEEGQPAAIYPSDTKYEESRRVPFVVLQDRLRRALHQSETIALITGFSFSDQHLNDMLFDAAARRERSELIAFCYSEIPDALADRAGSTPNLQVVTGGEAILGGIRAEWQEPDDPPPGLWVDGAFALRDFRYLASYLARSSAREDELEKLLRQLLARTESVPSAG
jgi:SIR2-like domain